jgi:hypothetical protein
MAKPRKIHPNNVNETPSLEEIVKAGPEGTSALWSHVEKWSVEGLVEVSPNGPDESGKIPVRATQKGIDSMNTVKVETYGIEIETNIPIPGVTGRGRGRNTTFPVDKLEVGQSFFVADDGDKKAAKLLTSVLTSAHKHYSEVIPGEFRQTRTGNDVPARRQTRQFVMRSVAGGARVWRVE